MFKSTEEFIKILAISDNKIYCKLPSKISPKMSLNENLRASRKYRHSISSSKTDNTRNFYLEGNFN